MMRCVRVRVRVWVGVKVGVGYYDVPRTLRRVLPIELVEVSKMAASKSM
jgi:hypothetical protein